MIGGVMMGQFWPNETSGGGGGGGGGSNTFDPNVALYIKRKRRRKR